MRKHMLNITLIALLIFGAPPALAAPRCFPEAAPVIADCVDGPLASYWEQNGGLPVFGYPIGAQSQAFIEGRSLQVQAFERNRLELHPDNPAPYDVLLGRLGVELLARQGHDWKTFPKADTNAPHYFAETGHAIAPEFWGYWSGRGLEFDGQPGASVDESVALFGMPISEARFEANPTDGKTYLTQWFERARFELHPESAGTPYEVQLGLLQRELASRAAASSAPPPTAIKPGGFIKVSGSQLTLAGQPIVLKGVNYYPQWRPWSQMWTAWDGPQVERELRQARDELGINTVRVLLPYNWTGKREGAGQVTPTIVGRLREMSQIAGSLDMRLLVTLYDFSQDFPAEGSEVDDEQVAYLRALLPQFANDERILGWDLHNEPDHYGAWSNNHQKVLAWLGRRADEVHKLAPKQLVTVGMGLHPNLLIPGPDGRRVIDYSDFVSTHAYDAATIGRQLDELRAQTDRPLVIEEFGWPTGPACVENYTEAAQDHLFHEMISAAQARGAGVYAWNLRDYDASPTKRWDSREEYFGLYRADGSLKPAAQALRAMPATPLPNAMPRNLVLTTTNPSFPDDATSPMVVPGSSYTVKGIFRQAWRALGGRESFGLPLTEAFTRPSDNRVVQYFEGAVLERNPDVDSKPGLSEEDQIKRLVKPQDIGAASTAGRELPATDGSIKGVFFDFYERINGGWRLGAPISAEFVEDIGGVPTRVQYFERGRLELNPATNAVAVGALGRATWDAVCAAQR
jgi:hypothetical protein